MSRAKRVAGKSALELLEEAAAALRASAPSTLFCYYFGTVPFVLAFLYFWADMSAGAYAEWHRSAAAFGMAAAFIWMKSWQAVFAGRLLEESGAEELQPWTIVRVWRLVVHQTAVQATGLFVLPVALLLTLPAAWTYAFYQSFLLDGRGEGEPLRVLIGRSTRQAALWAKQNHLAISYLSVFGLVVFVNFLTLLMIAPALVKMLMGVETLFSRSGFHLFNTTVVMIAGGLTHLTIDPVVKAFYVMRCFHGRSIQSGDDLKVTIRRLRRGVTAGVVVGFLVVIGGGGSAWGVEITSHARHPERSRRSEGSHNRSQDIPTLLDVSKLSACVFSLFESDAKPQDACEVLRSEDSAQDDSRCRFIPRARSQSPNWERTCLRISDSSHVARSDSRSGAKALSTEVTPRVARQFAGDSRISNQRFADNGIPNQRLGTSALVSAPPRTANDTPASAPTTPSADLDRAIQQVLTRPEFAWRSPRVPDPTKPESKPGVFERFVKAVGDFARTCWRPIRRWIRKVIDWVDRLMPHSHTQFDPSMGTAWKGTLEIVLYALCGLIVAAAAIIAWRAWRQRRTDPVVAAQAVQVTPDLQSEEVTADQLPEDRWLQLSDEMAARGEFRLSLRALYLAGLAHLGLRELITLTRAKSNKEFSSELGRHARARVDLLAAFGESVHAFERAWYGRDEVTREIVTRYASTVDQIRKC